MSARRHQEFIEEYCPRFGVNDFDPTEISWILTQGGRYFILFEEIRCPEI